jgi:hypothetical protein
VRIVNVLWNLNYSLWIKSHFLLLLLCLVGLFVRFHVFVSSFCIILVSFFNAYNGSHNCIPVQSIRRKIFSQLPLNSLSTHIYQFQVVNLLHVFMIQTPYCSVLFCSVLFCSFLFSTSLFQHFSLFVSWLSNFCLILTQSFFPFGQSYLIQDLP